MTHLYALQPFAPAFAPVLTLRISVEVLPAALLLSYHLTGPIEDLELARPEPEPGPRDELWQTTCFEIFTQWEGEKAYEEWNLSPSGCWAHYGFSAYRQRDPRFISATPQQPLLVTTAPQSFILQAQLPRPRPAGATGAKLHCGLSAVLHRMDDSRSYWALAHGGERPDFHDRQAFQLELDLVK